MDEDIISLLSNGQINSNQMLEIIRREIAKQQISLVYGYSYKYFLNEWFL